MGVRRWISGLTGVLLVAALDACTLPPICDETGATAAAEQACVVLNHPPEELHLGLTVQPVQGTPQVDRKIILGGSAHDPDGDRLFFEYDFNNDGEWDRAGNDLTLVEHIYREPGRKTITMRVTDFPGLPGGEGQATKTIQVRVYSSEELQNDHAPVASFTASPNPAGLGEVVRFEASASFDPDPDQVIEEYRWDFDGDGAVDVATTDSFTSHTFEAPGEYETRLHVISELSLFDAAESHASRTITVQAQSAPRAALTAAPNPAEVGERVDFSAAGSFDPDGDITTYEFDLDGDGVFEISGQSPMASQMYSQPGDVGAGVRVTDSGGRSDVATVVVDVFGEPFPSSREPRAAPRSSPGSSGGVPLAFSAVLGRRSLDADLLNPPGAGSWAERTLRHFLASTWRSRVRVRFDVAAQALRGGGIAVARAEGRGSPIACMRLRLLDRPGAVPVGRFMLIGGTGAGARLRATGTFRAAMAGEHITALGSVTPTRGPKRPAPKACLQLNGDR